LSHSKTWIQVKQLQKLTLLASDNKHIDGHIHNPIYRYSHGLAKDIYANIHECDPLLKSKVEVIPQGLSKLFGVGQQSTNRGKNNGVIGLTAVH